MTTRECLLLAAASLPESFTAEDLTVAAWQQYGWQFALKGHRDHPDHHRVLSALCGKKGLVGSGDFQRVVGGRYMLNPNRASTQGTPAPGAKPTPEPAPAPKPKPVPTPEPESSPLALPPAVIERLLCSQAVASHEQDLALTLVDCRSFWGDDLERDVTRDGLSKLQGNFVLPNGRWVSTAEVNELRAIDAALWRVWMKKGGRRG